MDITVLHGRIYNPRSLCNRLSFFFRAYYLEIMRLTPTVTCKADVIIVDCCKITEVELEQLSLRSKALDYAPTIAVLPHNGQSEAEMIKTFEFSEVYETENGLHNLVNLVIKHGEENKKFFFAG